MELPYKGPNERHQDRSARYFNCDLLLAERLVRRAVVCLAALGRYGYLVTRYVGWAINERRRLHREMDRLAAKVSRGEPLD